MATHQDFTLSETTRIKLLRLLMREGAQFDDAEDAVQAVCISIWKARKLDPGLSYLLISARRELARIARRKRSASTKQMLDDPDRRAVETHYDEMRLYAEVLNLRQTLPQALNKLNPGVRDTVLLWRMGESPAEIAEILGAKPSTVRSWLKRGVKHLQRFYGVVWDPVETGIRLSPVRLMRIAEIAGVSEKLVCNLLVETEYSNPEEHQAWLATTLDPQIASWVREVIQSLLPTDEDQEAE